MSNSRERFFPETGHSVRGPFLDFFERYGLGVCGYPVTEQIIENEMPTQYFQRLAMEEHEAGQIRLKLIGTELLQLREELRQLQEERPEIPQPEMEILIDDLLTHETRRYDSRPLTQIDTLVIHHTATSPTVTPQAVARYHVQEHGWPGIGYQFYLAADGTINQTNELTTISYHARQENPTSVGIALAGNFTDQVPTDAQIASAGHLCAYLLQELALPIESVRGHREVVQTSCPGQQWLEGEVWKDHLLDEIRRWQAGEVQPVEPEEEDGSEPPAGEEEEVEPEAESEEEVGENGADPAAEESDGQPTNDGSE